MRPIKLLATIPSLNPHLGGPTEVAINSILALRNIGFDAQIATTNDNGSEELEVPLGTAYEYRGVPVWFFQRSRLRRKEYIPSWEFTSWLWKNITNYSLLDLNYVFTYQTTCASIIARLKRVPYIVRTQGQLTPWSLAQSARKKIIYSALFDRSTLQHADGIWCTSEQESTEISALGIISPLKIIPLGVDLPINIPNARQELRTRYSLPDSKRTLLFLSRIHYKKRIELLLQSLRDLRSQGLDTPHLFIAGTGEVDYINVLKKAAADFGITDNVTFTGFVSGRDKDLLLQGSDIFVLPSFSENFGIAVVEALAAGTPVVISKGIQIGEIISSEGGGIMLEDPDSELTNTIREVLSNQALMLQLRSNCTRIVRDHFSWASAAVRLKALFEEIINKKNAS